MRRLRFSAAENAPLAALVNGDGPHTALVNGNGPHTPLVNGDGPHTALVNGDGESGEGSAQGQDGDGAVARPVAGVVAFVEDLCDQLDRLMNDSVGGREVEEGQGAVSEASPAEFPPEQPEADLAADDEDYG
ncbi:hypothetical protein IMZ48_44255, partial [Candidatus Bathyarchaeota archaeon]|nr:hypothetical protein [Candidatus Bathyarchaeota archaeon]